MTIAIQGISISRGIAIGKVHCIKHDQIDAPEFAIQKTQIKNEISRLNDAITNARSELQAIRDHIPKTTSINISEFIKNYHFSISGLSSTRKDQAERS